MTCALTAFTCGVFGRCATFATIGCGLICFATFVGRFSFTFHAFFHLFFEFIGNGFGTILYLLGKHHGHHLLLLSPSESIISSGGVLEGFILLLRSSEGSSEGLFGRFIRGGIGRCVGRIIGRLASFTRSSLPTTLQRCFVVIKSCI